MPRAILFLLVLGLALSLGACSNSLTGEPSEPNKPDKPALAANEELPKTEEEWKKHLTKEQYQVMREKGTERPFTGKYWNTKLAGTYVCAACGTPLFNSDAKFDSGCGWPSYFEPLDKDRIKYIEDHTHGMDRTEVQCAKCGAHLGHVFDDGPKPTGQRYCINSVSILLQEKKDEKKPDAKPDAPK
jgi:peptide-methionine (R)-S-oxide reductase